MLILGFLRSRFDDKLLPEPMMTYYQPNPLEQLPWNFRSKYKIFIQENAFENVVCNMLAILFRPPGVKAYICWHVLQNMLKRTLSTEYRQVSNIRRTLVGNKIVDHSDVVGASPVGAAPTTSSLST